VDQGQDQIRQILKFCYSVGVLTQPALTSTAEYMIQVSPVVECIPFVNDLNKLATFEPLDEYGSDIIRATATFDEQIFGKSLSEVFGLHPRSILSLVEVRKVEPEVYRERPRTEAISEPRLRIDDLKLKSLQEIGKLDIRWTTFVDKHLLLDDGPSALWVYWKPLPSMSNGIVSKLYNMYEVASLLFTEGFANLA